MIRFILIVLSLFTYTCFKFIQLVPLHPYLMILVGALIFALMSAPMMMSRFKSITFNSAQFIILTWTGYTLMGFWSTFIMISIPVDIIHLLISLFYKGDTFLDFYVNYFIFGLTALMTVIGLIQVFLGPKIVEVNARVENLASDLRDIKIAQISDLHIGPTIQTRYVEKVVAKTNTLNSDIIVITGDLVDAHTDSIKEHLIPLGKLKAKYGVYYVTGNHEYYWGVQTLLPELEKLGINILTNSNRVIDVNGSKILIAGVSDPVGSHFSFEHKPDIIKARQSQDKTDLNILLAHRPDPFNEAQALGFDLQFSGHTHGGQFFPFSLLIPFAHKYYRGLNRPDKMWLYVNPGTGYWGPANRFGISSEITLLTLV